MHLINSTLTDRGFGPQLLASVFTFTGEQAETVHLVYLYERGSFYPFAPAGKERRDNATVAGELPIEDDLTRWFPIWGVPYPEHTPTPLPVPATTHDLGVERPVWGCSRARDRGRE